MRIKHAFAVLGVGLLCAGGVVACGDDDDSSSSSGGGTTTAESSGGSTTTAGATGKIDPSKPPVQLALVTLKIPGADLLSSFQAGAEAAKDKINAAGGFGGRELKIDYCNSMLQPAAATVCARKTLQNDPVAEFGCDSVAWSTAGLPIYAKAKVPSFNCPNQQAEYENPYAFAINASQTGQRRGTAEWLCSRDDIKKVGLVTNDLPGEKETFPAQVDPILKGCGKETYLVQFPIAGGDLTPYVQKIVKGDPDFLIMSVIGPTAVNMYKLLKQNGINADQTAVPDTLFDYSVVLKDQGTLFDGTYAAAQFLPWGLDDPQVDEYLETMKGSTKDPRDPTVMWSYQFVQFFYAAAEKIGFDDFNAETLTNFMRTENGFPIPLSREVVNPGPDGYPQEKQPYILMVQYKGDGVFERAPGGDDSWFNGYLPAGSGGQ